MYHNHGWRWKDPCGTSEINLIRDASRFHKRCSCYPVYAVWTLPIRTFFGQLLAHSSHTAFLIRSLHQRNKLISIEIEIFSLAIWCNIHLSCLIPMSLLLLHQYVDLSQPRDGDVVASLAVDETEFLNQVSQPLCVVVRIGKDVAWHSCSGANGDKSSHKRRISSPNCCGEFFPFTIVASLT